MPVIVHIEHPVADLTRWKAAFDSDPIGRARMGVLRYRIATELADPAAVTIDLEVADAPSARAVLAALEQLWQTPVARGAMAGAPRARLLQVIESVELVGEIHEVASQPAGPSTV